MVCKTSSTVQGVFSLLKRSLTVFSRSDPDPDTDTDLCCLLFIKLLIHTDRISDIGSVRACAYACEVDCTVFSEFLESPETA